MRCALVAVAMLATPACFQDPVHLTDAAPTIDAAPATDAVFDRSLHQDTASAPDLTTPLDLTTPDAGCGRHLLPCGGDAGTSCCPAETCVNAGTAFAYCGRSCITKFESCAVDDPNTQLALCLIAEGVKWGPSVGTCFYICNYKGKSYSCPAGTSCRFMAMFGITEWACLPPWMR